jgi:hypothetical protein
LARKRVIAFQILKYLWKSLHWFSFPFFRPPHHFCPPPLKSKNGQGAPTTTQPPPQNKSTMTMTTIWTRMNNSRMDTMPASVGNNLLAASVALGGVLAVQLFTKADPIGRCFVFWKQLSGHVSAFFAFFAWLER